ncbi:MAG: hypothetical protein R3281_07180 [Balneolaceae bacterium]|nr:hypothetical protein [Balneolaceae bacterium]
MDRQTKIDREIKKTLHALDDTERAQTGDHFFSQLEARLEGHTPSQALRERSRPAIIAAAAIMLLLLLNLVTLSRYRQYFDNSDPERELYLEAFAEEYRIDLDNSVFYEFEPEDAIIPEE